MYAVAALLINAFVWGLSWMPFKALALMGLHPLWTTALIYSISSAVMITLCRKIFWALEEKSKLWMVAVTAGLTNACFNTAVTLGDVVRVILLFYLMPVWAVLLSRWILKEKLTPLNLSKACLGVLGAAVITGGIESGQALQLHPIDMLAIAGGFLFALNNILLKKMAHLDGRLMTMAMVSGACFTNLALASTLTLTGLIAQPVLLQAAGMQTLLLWSLLFMAANACLQYGASRLPATLTAVLMLSEIVFGSLSSWWMGQSEIGKKELLGGALILGAAMLGNTQKKTI
jgi:drug/metabolite transporter (DMT)-like permease